MRGMDDDDLSYRSGSISRSSSAKSFTGNLGIDWDEIDSIAEESLSVASSASSSHRKRTRRRTNPQVSGANPLDALESGALPKYTSSVSLAASKTSSHSSRGSGSARSRSKTPPRPTHPRPSLSQHQRKQHRRMSHNFKRLIIIAIIVALVTLSIHYSGSYLNQMESYSSALNKVGGDRLARRALSKSVAVYSKRKWPLSVRDEQADFELVPHPIHDKVILSLPRFYLTRSDGTLNTLGSAQQRQRPMTQAMANLVGRTTVEGSRDFSVRTIFVGIPSYRNDWHCRNTIESIYSRAKYPERIRVGVVHQLNEEQDQSCDLPIRPCSESPHQALCRNRNQIDVYEMDYKLAVGPMFARHAVNRLYRGEFYALQITAHTTFTKHWDVELIDQLEETGNEMGVITSYLGDASGSIDDSTGNSLKESRLVLCSASFEGAGHDRRLRFKYSDQPDVLPGIARMPQLQPFWSSSFSFSRGHFILTVPYDPYLPMVSKDDEEISMTYRAFTHGYDFYTPASNACFDSASGERLVSFLENHKHHNDVEKVSLRRLDDLLMIKEEKPYKASSELFGLGQVRPLSKFHTAFGVHSAEHITEDKLCNFVSNGRMHNLFQKHLREDGMGINYDLIHFRFHELQDNHEA